ncbi:MAG: AMP-binding protein [Catenulispora sp.]|nr:AMP-binding protein [Catenulispora sp.]
MSGLDHDLRDGAPTGPLTAQQRRLWFLDRLDPGDPAYHITTTVLLRGDLDADRLARAFDTVVARHESLRTRFVEVGGEPVQEVLPPAATPVLRADVPHEDVAQQAVRELIRAPFDLAAGRLIRIGLFRLDAERHVLCTVAHHIIGDGWSLNLLFRQASDVYRGAEPTAPAMRYLDYARAHQGEDEAALAYWRTALADAPVLELPPDRPRPARRTSAGVSASRVFDDGVWTAVQVVARELRCTPFMVLMSVYQLMLAQVSGQDDVCVGTPLAGRDEVAAESVFGYFVRMLVLRGDLSGDVTFRELVRRTRTACLGAFTHPWLPFEQLVADSAAPRDPSRNPLFQAAFTLHTTMDVSANGFESFEGVAVEGFGEGSRSTVTDVAMDVFVSSTAINARAGQDRMEVVLTASADLFDAHGAERLADRFSDVLHTVLADPDARVRELPLVGEAERAELLRIGSGPALDVGLGTLDRIELVAALTPDAVAVEGGPRGQRDGDGLGGGERDGGEYSGDLGGSEHAGGLGGGERLTYGQLWANSGQLADALRAAGVAPGHLVGVSLPRGAEQIVALLAVWRCGAGYVPFDPALPEHRRSMLTAQAGVAAMVTPEGVRHVPGTPTVAEDPAYVVFTSGSTGVPKPVLVGRTAVAERVAWMVPAYELTAADRVVQFADLGFDTHAEEIWPTLSAGATLVLLPEGPRSLPEVLAADPAITVLDLPTAYWQALLDLKPAWPQALRLVILGGEQVDATAIGRWRNEHGDGIRLVNTYGPSEATIIATATDLTAADTEGELARRPPIGRPIGNVRAYVVDTAGRLVPRGTPGELCLAGAGLADGYLGLSDLTAERFTPDPYGSGLMYRTGDRARWRRDEPVLEFLGRLDRQLKVRGVRIEPGEVEAVLAGRPDVGQVVVTAFGDSLIAYVTGTAAADDVRAYAAERLPALLVPSVVVPLAELPLTRHGKVDIAALPVPAADDAVKTVFEPPRTEAEELVALIFAELLPVERVGVHDDFFVLGGHSLLAIRVIARVRAVVGLDLPVRLLFDQPTVAGFAEAVEAALFADIDQLTEEEAEAQLAARMEAG